MVAGMRPGALTEEEWRVEQLLWESDHICSDCGEELHLTDEVYLVQAVYIGYDANGHLNNFILNDADGGYLYEPQFLHEMCWSALWEDFWSECGDLHVDQEPQLQVAECDGCSSGIRIHEVSAMVNLGELRRSKRSPDGNDTLYFDPCHGAPMFICIECLTRFNEEAFEMWDDLTIAGVCRQGIQERCWRYGNCAHGCQLIRAAE